MKQQNNLLNKASKEFDCNHLSPLRKKLQFFLRPSFHVTNKIITEIQLFKPFVPRSDQDIISPYNINIISSRLVLRIMKDINQAPLLFDWTSNSLNHH